MEGGHQPCALETQKRALTPCPLFLAAYRPGQTVQAEGDKACNATTEKVQLPATDSDNKMELTAAASGLFSKTLVTLRARLRLRAGRRVHEGWG